MIESSILVIIMNDTRLRHALKIFRNEWDNINPVFLAMTGSYLSNTATEYSDFDIKGIYILPTEQFLDIDDPKLSYHSDENNKPQIMGREIDFSIYEIKKIFQEILKQGRPNINIFNFNSLQI